MSISKLLSAVEEKAASSTPSLLTTVILDTLHFCPNCTYAETRKEWEENLERYITLKLRHHRLVRRHERQYGEDIRYLRNNHCPFDSEVRRLLNDMDHYRRILFHPFKLCEECKLKFNPTGRRNRPVLTPCSEGELECLLSFLMPSPPSPTASAPT